MNKNYLYLIILLVATIVITLTMSSLYGKVTIKNSYSYENFNRISSNEFEEYMIEHPDTIIYIGDKTNLTNNKFEKKLINKLKQLNLLKNVIYIDKDEVSNLMKMFLKEKYSYIYIEKNLPIIIVINDGVFVQAAKVEKNSNANNIINYKVFE